MAKRMTRFRAIAGLGAFALVIAAASRAFAGDTALPMPVLAQLEIGEQFQAFYREFVKGGIIMWVLLGLSVIALTFLLERLIRLRRGRIVPRGFAARVDLLWKQRRYEEIHQFCAMSHSSLSRITDFVTRHRHSSPGAVSMAVAEMGMRELRPEFRRAFPLALIAMLAPLLGLLGTVQGMIGAFDNFKHLTGVKDPGIFADDIAKALYTTAFGLSLAVPCLAFYHIFRNMTNKYGDILETEVSDLVNEWLVLGDDLDEGDGDGQA